MKWLRKLFGKTEEPPRTSQAELRSSIAGATSSLGQATLTMLIKLEEMMQKPLSDEERRSLTQSLDMMEGTLSTGMIPSSDAKQARDRIAALRARLQVAEPTQRKECASMKSIISNLREASWNNQKDAVEKREMIENTWHVRFKALALSEQQCQDLANQAPLDEHFRDINDQYHIRLSTNAIHIHEFGAWTDPGYVMFFYQDNLYYVNVALGVQLTTSIYNRSDELSHMAKMAIVLKDEIGARRKQFLIALEGDLKHRAA